MAYAEHKVDKKLVEGPIEELCGNPDDRQPGGGVWNGEDGPYEKRTTGPNSLPEKTLDEAGDFGHAPAEG